MFARALDAIQQGLQHGRNPRIAQMFGYEDATYTLAVEQLMQRYYRAAKSIYRLNTILLQNIWARIGPPRGWLMSPM